MTRVFQLDVPTAWVRTDRMRCVRVFVLCAGVHVTRAACIGRTCMACLSSAWLATCSVDPVHVTDDQATRQRIVRLPPCMVVVSASYRREHGLASNTRCCFLRTCLVRVVLVFVSIFFFGGTGRCVVTCIVHERVRLPSGASPSVLSLASHVRCIFCHALCFFVVGSTVESCFHLSRYDPMCIQTHRSTLPSDTSSTHLRLLFFCFVSFVVGRKDDDGQGRTRGGGRRGTLLLG